jgi:hypothetical protein
MRTERYLLSVACPVAGLAAFLSLWPHDQRKGGRHRPHLVSAVRGPGHCPDATFQFASSLPERLPRDADPVKKIRLAVALRNEWLAVGLSTAPADRSGAEAAVCRLYDMAGASPPAFEWAPSPLAALAAIQAARSCYPAIETRYLLTGQPRREMPVAARLASLETSLRSRLDARIGRAAVAWPGSPGTDTGTVWMYRPEDAVLSGISDRSIVVVTVGQSLRGTLTDAVAVPLRAALAEAIGKAASGDQLTPTGGVIAFRGQHDASWIGYYDTRRRAGFGGYASADLGELDVWAALARSAGWWWPGEGLCVMAERPVAVHAEPLIGSHHGELRLHRADGLAIAFADDFGANVLHGTPVPEWVLSGPTVDLIRAEPNIEVRRSAIERLGWEAYIRDAGMRLVASCPDPGNPGAELGLYDDIPGAGRGAPGRVLVVTNGTPEPGGHRRRYGINVPGNLDNPVDAAAWTYGLSGELYATIARRT